jgi:hypothetical protein
MEKLQSRWGDEKKNERGHASGLWSMNTVRWPTSRFPAPRMRSTIVSTFRVYGLILLLHVESSGLSWMIM